MLEQFEIKNYKSINECSVELGKFNIFIGENGCGKSNILEALAMLSVAKFSIEITTEELYNKGVRVANPKLTFSSFKGKKQTEKIRVNFTIKKDNLTFFSEFISKNQNDIYSIWSDNYNDIFREALFGKIFDTNKNLEILNKEIDSIIQEIPNNLSKDEAEKTKNNFINKLKDNLTNSLTRKKYDWLKDYIIYNIETKALRGITTESKKQPLGINGEGLDILIADFNKDELSELLEYSKFISWFDKIEIDQNDILKYKGHKLGKSNSLLYFKDKFMNSKNNIFSAENANEGILHVLFYLSLFISTKTPKFFAIDNIEKSLNPKLCRTLIKELAKLSKEKDKQALITTHNPAILDGLNLYDDEQRLFVVSRTDEGYTKIERIKLKPQKEGEKYKLSEMWMRGYLGGIPNNF